MAKVSIVIPTRRLNDYLRRKTIPAILAQTFQDFEIIILSDSPSKEKYPKTKIIPCRAKIGPAKKRNLGAKEAKGEILAFIDDDAYPEKDWLKNALFYFKNPQIAAVCGPGVTPPGDNLKERVSGWVWQSWLGAGGAGTYRCVPEKKREVDDYPSFNLIIRKKDFEAVGGFDPCFWPGEDTKLCHDLVYKQEKKIIYDPKILVYHHRRQVFIPHLLQISRFAIHRGYFARILPKTSCRLGYFVPSFFVLGLFGGAILIFVLEFLSLCTISIPLVFLYLLAILVYLFLLLTVAIKSYLKEKNLALSFLLIPAIFLTHLVYGVLFIKGFFAPKLKDG